jgi:hypothetical protein
LPGSFRVRQFCWGQLRGEFFVIRFYKSTILLLLYLWNHTSRWSEIFDGSLLTSYMQACIAIIREVVMELI